MNKPIEYTEGVKRFEDMSPDGFIKLLRQADGDVILQVSGKDWVDKLQTVDVEFCTSGGQSINTLLALINLIEAVKQDNEEKPQYRQNGELK